MSKDFPGVDRGKLILGTLYAFACVTEIQSAQRTVVISIIAFESEHRGAIGKVRHACLRYGFFRIAMRILLVEKPIGSFIIVALRRNFCLTSFRCLTGIVLDGRFLLTYRVAM